MSSGESNALFLGESSASLSDGDAISSRPAPMSRRSFVASAAVASAGAAAAFALGGCGGNRSQQTGEEVQLGPVSKDVWTHCASACGSACALKCHVTDGRIVYVEGDSDALLGVPEASGDSNGAQSAADFRATDASKGESAQTKTSSKKSTNELPQMRACLRGRTINTWLSNSERLSVPLKRTGERGSGLFQEIGWDEAVQIMADAITQTREEYGNSSIAILEGAGVRAGMFRANPIRRLMNLCGGYLELTGTYGSAQMDAASKFTYGEAGFGSSYSTLEPGQLVVLFGASPAETSIGGAGQAYELINAMRQKNVEVVCIDPRMNDTVSGLGAEWIPIRPGTDAALCAALAYELITNGWVDREFLRTYTIGFTDATLPKNKRGKNASYEAYILGDGSDATPKTPEWAARITQVSAGTIRRLAKRMAQASHCFVTQGFGPQRHSNGELTARAIMTLPLLLGQVGHAGGNCGRPAGTSGFNLRQLPIGLNSVRAKLPVFMWAQAIKNPQKLTAVNAGLSGVDAPKNGIKLLFNYASNLLAGQHADVNGTLDTLRDETRCEYIFTIDVVMTPSALFSDLVLPDLTSQEQISITSDGPFDDVRAIVFGEAVVDGPGISRGIYDVCWDLAVALGVDIAYSEGRYRETWTRDLYTKMTLENKKLPTWNDGYAKGVYKRKPKQIVSLSKFIQKPEENKLPTESGKIEIYSAKLASIARRWDTAKQDVIHPLPIYAPGFESHESVTKEYPLQIIGFHCKANVNSTYTDNDIITAATMRMAWINPIDAKARHIKDGDAIRICSARGELQILAKVTSRIMPGVVAIPQGSSYAGANNPEAKHPVDLGGCINVLTLDRPSPLAHGSSQGSIVGQVKKV